MLRYIKYAEILVFIAFFLFIISMLRQPAQLLEGQVASITFSVIALFFLACKTLERVFLRQMLQEVADSLPNAVLKKAGFWFWSEYNITWDAPQGLQGKLRLWKTHHSRNPNKYLSISITSPDGRPVSNGDLTIASGAFSSLRGARDWETLVRKARQELSAQGPAQDFEFQTAAVALFRDIDFRLEITPDCIEAKWRGWPLDRDVYDNALQAVQAMVAPCARWAQSEWATREGG